MEGALKVHRPCNCLLAKRWPCLCLHYPWGHYAICINMQGCTSSFNNHKPKCCMESHAELVGLFIYSSGLWLQDLCAELHILKLQILVPKSFSWVWIRKDGEINNSWLPDLLLCCYCYDYVVSACKIKLVRKQLWLWLLIKRDNSKPPKEISYIP